MLKFHQNERLLCCGYHGDDGVDVVLLQEAGGAAVLGSELDAGAAPVGIEVDHPQLAGRPAPGPLLLHGVPQRHH